MPRLPPKVIIEEVEEVDDEEKSDNINFEHNLSEYNSPEPQSPSTTASVSSFHVNDQPNSLANSDNNSPTVSASTNAKSDDDIANLVLLGTLSVGRSRFGDRLQYVNKVTMWMCAANKLQAPAGKWSKEELVHIHEELDNFVAVKHKRIADLYGYHIAEDSLTFFRMYASSGTAEDKLRREPLSEHLALKYAGQTLEALHYCHSQTPPILHMNIKASNLLLTISGDIKLCDFGVASTDHQSINMAHYRRSLLAAAQELHGNLLVESAHTKATDIWSVGSLIVEMLTGLPPFGDLFSKYSDDQLLQEVQQFYRTQNWPTSSAWSQDGHPVYSMLPTASSNVTSLLCKLMTHVPQRRPTAAQALRFEELKRFNFEVEPPVPAEEEIPKMEDEVVETAIERVSAFHADHEQLLKKLQKQHKEEESSCFVCGRWYFSRALLFAVLLLKWVGLVLLAACSLASVAFFVFLAIFVIYNGIGIVCQCHLNEGFIVLIALILLPILILLTTLCCNNSIEKYKQAVKDGTLEKSKYVYKQPEDDIVMCGVIVVPGSHKERRRKHATEENDPQSILSGLKITADFANQVRLLA